MPFSNLTQEPAVLVGYSDLLLFVFIFDQLANSQSPPLTSSVNQSAAELSPGQADNDPKSLPATEMTPGAGDFFLCK